jgi:4'-phosphopantetheinyl transferase
MEYPIYWILMDAPELAVDPAGSTLGPAERKQYEAMRFPKRRQDWLLGRRAAKTLIRAVVQPGPEAMLEIRHAPGGAPLVWVDGGPRPDLCLSISHSGSRAFCALVSVPGVQVGADLESIEQRSEAFFQDYFTSVELAWLKAVDEQDAPLAASLLWSAKESMLKALRVGLHMDTRRVEVRQVEGIGEAGDDWKGLLVAARGLRWQAWWRRTGESVQTLAACTGGMDKEMKFRLERVK